MQTSRRLNSLPKTRTVRLLNHIPVYEVEVGKGFLDALWSNNLQRCQKIQDVPGSRLVVLHVIIFVINISTGTIFVHSIHSQASGALEKNLNNLLNVFNGP